MIPLRHIAVASLLLGLLNAPDAVAGSQQPDAKDGDVLVLENCVLQKADQKPLVEDGDWRAEYELD